MVAAVPGRKYKYFNDYKIRNAPWFTFLWDITFPLGFSRSLPRRRLLRLGGGTIGDVTNTCFYAAPDGGRRLRVARPGRAAGRRRQLRCSRRSSRRRPTDAAQNNGVIQLTQCASRAAGFACAFWLILFGVIGKIGAAFSSIPICVVGGVVLQCSAMVFVSGMNIATRHATRRNNYILMVALALGIGVGMEPQLFEAAGPRRSHGAPPQHRILAAPQDRATSSRPSRRRTR
ncbi:xanthine transmembrane transporter [Aureococcus anophagefferens]|nr:xanthine transmembrane transporter [Aureococcus anophagefferens]